jgi:hypothetical protein
MIMKLWKEMKKEIVYILIILFMSFTGASAQELYPIAVDNKVGYINSSGEIVIEPQFDTEVTYHNIVYKDKTFESIYFPKNAYFSEGKATVRIGEWFWFIPLRYSYAIINEKGTVLVDSGMKEFKSFKNDLAIVIKPLRWSFYVYNHSFGYVNPQGKDVIKPIYQYAAEFSEHTALVMYNDHWGYIDTSGKFKIEAIYKEGESFSEGLAAVKKDSLFGYKDTNGNWVIPEKYVKAWSFHNDAARIYDGKDYRFINRTGNFINDNKYPAADDFSEGLAKVIVEAKSGFINTKGEFAIKPRFRNATSFENGIAAVDLSGKWGFIDKTGNYIIEPQYDFAKNFRGELAVVWLNDEMFYINKRGEPVSNVFWDTKSFLGLW